MESIHHRTAEFLRRAEEAGLLDQMEKKIEAENNAERLAMIAKISDLPRIAPSEFAAGEKKCAAAIKELEHAEELLLAAKEKYRQLSLAEYYKKNTAEYSYRKHVDSIRELSPTFLKEAIEDLGLLDDRVKDNLTFWLEAGPRTWFGAKNGIVNLNNSESINACRAEIKQARDRIMQMMIEPTPLATAREEAMLIMGKVEAKAFEVGVDKIRYLARRKPVDTDAKMQDQKDRETAKRRDYIAAIAR